jgi:alpha-beta hydrolase superfamily lysophospholipase
MPPLEHAPQPLYFGDPAAPLFGWWHAPRSPQRDLAVVLCPALGREEVSSHRSLRVWAQRLAQGGLPVLRFDLPGTGDSSGDMAMPGLVDAWRAALAAAIDEARRLSSAQRVAVLGLRLGALLAADCGAAAGGVDLLIAVAPVLAGRAHLRELKALQAASATPGNAPAADGLLEAGGYALTPEVQQAINGLDVRTPPRAPAVQVLLIDRDDMPGSERWAETLRPLGSAVELQRLPGYAAMMQDPHHSQVPEAMVAATAGWLLARSTAVGVVPPPAPVRSEARFGAIVEQALRIPFHGGAIEAVLSRPVQAASEQRPRTAVLLLNAGAQRRIGPSRLHTALARRWAAAGLTVLRLDLMGLGDSAPPQGEAGNVVYPDSGIAQVREAVNALRTEHGAERCIVIGLCAGAYHALKAAVAGPGVDAAVAINPLTFFWRPGMSLDPPLPAHKVVSEMARYRQAMGSWQRWRKLLHGQVDVKRLAQILARRSGARLSHALRGLGRALRLPLHDDLARELRTAAVRHGTMLQFVFAEGDAGDALLHEQGGRTVQQLQQQGRLAVHRIADADHTFTGSVARAALEQLLDSIVLTGTSPMPAAESPVHRMAAEAAAP